MAEYIEKEAAIKIQCEDCGGYGFCDNDCSAVESIKRVPAADVRPVVRGKWEWDVLDGTPGYRPVVLCCSNCHRVSFSGWSYCPNCGAMMEES